jgi:hypothetical protein
MSDTGERRIGCAEAQEMFLSAVEDETVERQILAHAARCPLCSDAYREFKDTILKIHDAAREAPDAPGLPGRVLEAIRLEQERRASRRRLGLLLLPVAFVAVAALSALAALALSNRGARPGPDPALVPRPTSPPPAPRPRPQPGVAPAKKGPGEGAEKKGPAEAPAKRSPGEAPAKKEPTEGPARPPVEPAPDPWAPALAEIRRWKHPPPAEPGSPQGRRKGAMGAIEAKCEGLSSQDLDRLIEAVERERAPEDEDAVRFLDRVLGTLKDLKARKADGGGPPK